MKIRLLFLLFIWTAGYSFSQVITTSPQFPTESDSIIIYFDAAKGDAGLKGFTGDVYAYTGVFTTKINNWSHIVNSAWLDNPAKTKLIRISTDKYELVIGNPRVYYNLTDITEHITKLAFVFRNSDGSKSGRDVGGADIFSPLYEGGLTINFVQPRISTPFEDLLRSPYFMGQSDSLEIKATVVAINAKISTLTLYVNDIQTVQTNTDSLKYIFSAAEHPAGVNKISAVAIDTAGLIDTSSFDIIINSPVIEAQLPQEDQLGINYNSSASVTFALFAPYKKFVYVIGDFNDWKVDTNYLMKEDSVKADSVVWWLTINNLEPGKEYAFQYFIDGNLRIADPFSHKVLDPSNDQYISSTIYPGLKPYPSGKTDQIVSILQTDQQPYNWKIKKFKKPDKSNLIIYELLVRDFVSTHWFKSVMDSLNYLKNLGVNAIEFMPVMEFEGNDSWGYNPSFHLALDKYYGTPDAFKALVDSAHSKGMAVILDVVLNHAYGQNPLVRMYFASNGTDQIVTTTGNPYFNTISPNPTYHWGADFNHAKPATQYYVDRVTSYWINEFHIDGYRFDFAKGFTNTSGDGGSYDQSRIAIMQRMAKKIWAVDSTSILILENFVDNNEEKVESDFGFLSWGNMNYNYNEATMGYNLPGHSDLSSAYYFNRGWPEPSLVAYMESHDEERLMYKNEQYGNHSFYYNVKNISTALNRMGEAAAFFFTIPGPKMIWQFGELGYDYSINYPSLTSADRITAKPIRWDFFNNPDRQKLYRIFSVLIKLRNSYSIFQTSAIMKVTDSLKSIQFSDSSMKVNIIGNFGVYQSNMNPNFQQPGKWYDYFAGDSIIVSDINAAISLAPGEYHIYTSVKLPKPDLNVYTEVGNKNPNLITGYKLEQNYPNPFNPSTTIKYQILKAGLVTIKVYDILGREIKTIVNKFHQSGSYEIQLKADNLASGIYFYQLRTDNFVSTKKMILLK